MRAEVRLLAAAVVPIKTEQVMNAILVIGPLWCGPKPAIEIEAFGWRAIGDRFFSPSDPIRRRESHIDFADFSNRSLPKQFDGQLEFSPLRCIEPVCTTR